MCPACAAGWVKTRDGRYHPGFNGKRFFKCRSSHVQHDDHVRAYRLYLYHRYWQHERAKGNIFSPST